MSLDCEEYNRTKAGKELLEILAEAEDDVSKGKVAAMKDTFYDLRAILMEKRGGVPCGG